MIFCKITKCLNEREMQVNNNDNKNNTFSKWGEKINWEKRVKAVCKPCWEIKYCPYGPLIEEFPIIDEDDNKRCIIYGHICPVYRVAEPFTETKELRNISRNIPRTTIIKVTKRDGMVCQLCGKNLLIGEEQFDHIIPWSKGGSSDENNIRLLCEECNKKRSNNFEKEMLVNSFLDHVRNNIELSTDQIDDLLLSIDLMHEHYSTTDKEFSLKDFISSVEKATGREVDKEMLETIFIIMQDFKILEEEKTIGYLSKNETEIIKYRWGYLDGNVHSMSDTCLKYNKEIKYLFDLERYLFEFLGFEVKNNKTNINKYLSGFDSFFDVKEDNK